MSGFDASIKTSVTGGSVFNQFEAVGHGGVQMKFALEDSNHVHLRDPLH